MDFNVCMFYLSTVLPLTVAVLVGSGTATWWSLGSAVVSSRCRQQLVFDALDGYACDVIVTSSTDADDVVKIGTVDTEIPHNATAVRVTLRHVDASSELNGSGGRSPLPQLPELRSLEIDVSDTRLFPVGLLSHLGATSVRRLSLFRSSSTDANEFRLRLPVLSEGAFATSNGRLTTLILSDLGIDQLPTTTFNGLTTLRDLFVNNNRLTSLPVGLFDGLCQLSSVSLARNHFVDVADLSLVENRRPRRQHCHGGGLAHLKSLDLHGNRLRRLRAGAFRSLRNIVELNLSGNELSTLDVDAFSGLTELRTLYLDDNRLAVVSASMFVGLSRLTTLDISRNRLTYVANGAFRHLAALRTLRLRQNQIRAAISDAWVGLRALSRLDMSSNRMTRIDSSMFTGLCNLSELNLSDNNATTVDDEAFRCLTTLSHLDLSGNLLSDAERRRLEERRWPLQSDDGADRPVCDECPGGSSVTMSSSVVVVGYGQSNYRSAASVDPCDVAPTSGAVTAKFRVAVPTLDVMLAVSAAAGALFLTLITILCLLKRRHAMLSCRQRTSTSTYSPHTATVCTLDGSVDGIYVKFHT